MEEWKAQIDLLQARAAKAKTEAKIECNKTIEALQHSCVQERKPVVF